MSAVAPGLVAPVALPKRGPCCSRCGWSHTNSSPNATIGLPTIDPFLWENGQMRELGTLGGTIGTVNWLNDAGAVVGQSDLAGEDIVHPFLWQHGRMRDLGSSAAASGPAAASTTEAT